MTPHDSERVTAAKLAPLKAACDAQRAAAERARLTQWGTASPGGLLAESHVRISVNCDTPTQGGAVTHLRQGGDL